jgi:hypothetical protein
MNIKLRNWLIFIFLSALCFGLWYKLEYPRFTFTNLPVNKQQAFLKAKEYLFEKGVDVSKYSYAAVFESDQEFDRFMQHCVGLMAEKEFIVKHEYDLFYWRIRFFKELQKEEYFIDVSAGSGKVISYEHLIEDIEPRTDLGRDAAKEKAESFLRETFGIDLTKYDFHEEKIKRYEKRIDFVFSWEKKGVYIPWKDGQGGAKLLARTVVSGEEIREFYKNNLELPEKFRRYVESQFILGDYLRNFYFILYLVLIAVSISVVLKKKSYLIPRLTRKWYYYLAALLAVISISRIFNNMQSVIMYYPTSAPLSSFLGLSITREFLNTIFLAVGIIMPGIAGETLVDEVLPKNKKSSFLYYIKSSFFNRGVTRAILFGYVLWLISLGLQAVMFYFGQKYLGVWREWYNIAQFSSAYIPAFNALIIASTASLNEEVMFRIFGISLAKKYLRSAAAAVLITSFMWGMGHTQYAIFPVWFRIIEISALGLFYGFIFLRFGIIPLVVAHYLFDVFWCSSAYILGHGSLYLFISSIGVLCIPLGFAISAHLLNRGEREREIKVCLDRIQQYNLQVLITFIAAKKSQGYTAEMARNELVNNNWDHSLVELAICDVYKQ